MIVNRDLEHLKLLSIFHYVFGGIVGLFACFPLIHVTVGTVLIVVGSSIEPGNPAPALFGLFFVVMGGAFLLIGWAQAALILAAGWSLGRRKHHTFCFVVACLSCLSMPLGTVLGVFTIIVLSRQSVRSLFQIGEGTIRPSVLAPIT